MISTLMYNILITHVTSMDRGEVIGSCNALELEKWAVVISS